MFIEQDFIEEETILEEVTPSEIMILTKYRLQQSRFRKNLINHWGGCSLINCKNHKLQIASHIKPYSECDEEEKYDLYNGLLLTPNFDKLFDNYLISFNELGKVLLAASLNAEDLKKLKISGKEKLNMDKVTEMTQKYLNRQRENFIIKNL